MNKEQDCRQQHQSDAKPVDSNESMLRQALVLPLSSIDLQSQRTGNCARKISRSNALAILKSERLVILSRVPAMTQPSRSWSSPGRNAPKGTRNLEGKSGVNFFYGAKADSGNSKRVHQYQFAALDFNTWDYVAKPNHAQDQSKPEQSFYYITNSKENGLAGSQSGQQQGNHGYQIAGEGPFAHNQIDSLEGSK